MLPTPTPTPRSGLFRLAFACFGFFAVAPASGAQEPPDRVLVRTGDVGPRGPLPADVGAGALWHRLKKAGTTASILYTAGHPDDEEAGVLTLLSRGEGVRTALLTLNRGEGGANAIGPELFDALGLIRSEELRLAGRYYGLDDQYFTTAADYGYSKTLDEAMRSWDREALLGDMVRIIRLNRPLLVVSRWHGSERDGHGHHQAAGELTPEAVWAAADPRRFPDQIRDEGLRPWKVHRLYRSRLRDGEPFHVELDPWRTDPFLGTTYQEFGAYGLSLQRSQTSGRVRSGGPRNPVRWERLPAPGDPEAGTVEGSGGLFTGLDTSLSGVGTLTGETLAPDVLAALRGADDAMARARAGFDATDPGAVIPDLRDALRGIRRARAGLADGSDADFLLAVEEREAADALLEAADVRLDAVAVSAGAPAGSPTPPAVPGQRLDVHVAVRAAASADVRVQDLDLVSRAGWTGNGWDPGTPRPVPGVLERTLELTIPADAGPTRPWFTRRDIRWNRYTVLDSAELHLGESRPGARVVADLTVAGEPVRGSVPVTTIESDAPWGVLRRPLAVVPAVTVSASPAVVVPRRPDGAFDVEVRVTAHAADGANAEVFLNVPPGWTTDSARVALTTAGQAETVTLRVTPATDAPAAGDVRIVAAARSGERTVTQGFQRIDHRDLQVRRLYRAAETTVAWIDVEMPEGLRVGYVMGVGDDVPAAIAQLGADVVLLGENDLAGGDLTSFDAIVVGTRAYAVRPDLVAANARLLAYAAEGGNLVVLYQTPEYDPATQAPFPASLPGNAEEVSEEDAPVRLLAPGHPLLTTPNPITPTDFDGWIEQRGSKFFASWDDRYTPLVETHDTGQPPQEGVWLAADVGSGHFSYVALALHRQLPWGVHGAWRILANLLSRGR